MLLIGHNFHMQLAMRYPFAAGMQRKKAVLPRTKTVMSRRRWLTLLALAGGTLLGAVVILWILWPGRCPQAAIPIFEGVTYQCERLQQTAEGTGALHVVRVDLAAPGIELYVTPLDPTAVAAGWQYRLGRIAQVVNRERLAVAINATLFKSESGWWRRMGGDLATGVETVVADHVVSHILERTHLLWFDDQLTPHLRTSTPPSSADLARAKWAVGALEAGLRNGQVWGGLERTPDSRTAVAVDSERKLLFLAVAEKISPHLMLRKLAELGAQDGIMLDGGHSSAMAVGEGAQGISAGVRYGGWWPVATHFGVRARRLHR